jgi:hypothetical protein
MNSRLVRVPKTTGKSSEYASSLSTSPAKFRLVRKNNQIGWTVITAKQRVAITLLRFEYLDCLAGHLL